jgi:hypothetical protein
MAATGMPRTVRRGRAAPNLNLKVTRAAARGRRTHWRGGGRSGLTVPNPATLPRDRRRWSLAPTRSPSINVRSLSNAFVARSGVRLIDDGHVL